MAWIGSSLLAKVQRRPGWMRAMMGLPQRLFPVINTGGMVALFKDADIREVHERSECFEFGALNRHKMLCGRFLLGLDDEPPNLEEKEALKKVLDALRDNRLQAAVKDVWGPVGGPGLRKDLSDKFTAGRGIELDLVDDFSEPFVTKLTVHFFGLPAPTQSSRVVKGQGEVLLAQWIRKIGSLIAVNSPGPFGLQRVAEKCAGEFIPHVEGAIDDVFAAPPNDLASANTVLEGIVGEYQQRHAGNLPDKKYVRRNLAGMLFAGNAPIIKSFVNLVDQLLRLAHPMPHGHPNRASVGSARPPLMEAISAARFKDAGRLRHYVLEALRFNPTFPLMVRHCPRAESVSERTPRQTEIASDAAVFVPPIAAMFDRERVRRAETFAHERPEDEYLLFGYGGHVCLGRDIAMDALIDLTGNLLSYPGADLVQPGRHKYDGPAVDHYRVNLTAPTNWNPF